MNLNVDIKQLLQSLQSLQNIDMKRLSRRTDILVNVAVVVITLISLKMIYANQAGQLETLEKKLKEAEGTTELIDKIQNTEKEIEDYLKKLPIGKDFPDIIKTITGLASENDVEITTINQAQREYAAQYYTLPMQLSIKGPYHNIWVFLRDLEESEEFFTLTDVDINGPGESSRFDENEKKRYSTADIDLFATSVREEYDDETD